MLTLKMPATLDEVIAAESQRPGWVSVIRVRDSLIHSVSRYKRGYFRVLTKEGRLVITKDELVIGLD
jgi:hypothetical protein